MQLISCRKLDDFWNVIDFNILFFQVFFMKAHIFSGQVKVDNKEIVDFAWVTKQEMKDYVAPEYYEAVQDMLSDF